MTLNNFNNNTVYRSRYGIILGICKGISEHFEIPVMWLRIGVILIAITTGVWPIVLAYFGLAFYLKPKPILPLSSEGENAFYDSYTSSRSSALHRVKEKFDSLNKRIHRMEDIVTSKDFNWKNKFPNYTTNKNNDKML